MIFRRHGACAVMLALSACHNAPALVKQREGAHRVLFKGVTVLDTVGVRWLEGPRDVWVEGGTVTRMEASIPDVTADVVYQGGTLMPGLTDAHVHLFNGGEPPWKMGLPDEKHNLQAFLFAGVTTVMDQGAMNFSAHELGEKTARGELPGPRVLAAGPMFTATGGHPADVLERMAPWLVSKLVVPRMTRQVSSPSEVAEPMAEVLAHNPDFIKVVVDHLPSPQTPRLDAATLNALVAAAHQGKKKVFAHVGRSQDALDAVNAGVDVLAHGIYMDALTEEALSALAAHHVPVVVTMSVFRSIERLGIPPKPEFSVMERRVAGEELLAAFRPVPTDTDPALRQWTLDVAANREVAMENTRKLRARGVPVLVGSDGPNAGHFAGGGLHTELDLLVEAGIPPVEVLCQAARGNHRAWGSPLDVGEIVVGKPADVFWVKGDVAADFKAVHAVGAVFTEGRLWEPVK